MPSEYTYTIETEDDDSPNLYKKAANQTTDRPTEETDAVMELLQTQLESSSMTESGPELAAAGEALAAIATQHNAAVDVKDRADLRAREIGKNIQFIGGGDRILGAIEPHIGEVEREQAEEKVEELAETGSAYTLDYGVGLDEYIENRLERVVELTNRDHVSEYTFEFNFSDGTSVEFENNDHRDEKEFYDRISTAAPVKVHEEYASAQAREDISGNPSEDDWAEEQYRKLSLGPEERPWGLSWNNVIVDLEDDKGEGMAEPPAGPRTDAWEDLQTSIENGRAAHDRQSVVDAADGAVHYNEDHDEVWVPTSMVDAACEDYATNREKLVRELDARGVTTDEISGMGCSVAKDGIRWWRLKASAVEMPRIVQSIEEADTFASAGKAAADGGTTTFGGDE
ncbi:hypothetical protein HLRTI_001349 [Halorhabdus tiamatea SARL4B]|uniref:Uncharacterized protein n=1 Tax=Halorhabdus tiamatea SARL4B TaxID=1033806 RepID=F7PI48_9EURY|nr:hypothetical protein [Halorhabdus tiamatea]ERJ06643.1 hypothetical protein HLRTI_001349 [Halorhabdus tiamatea SARL4B]CCQ32207.1 hypothetical protein HTIA_0056 [Halorhabdus tiamatea SARL4B]